MKLFNITINKSTLFPAILMLLIQKPYFAWNIADDNIYYTALGVLFAACIYFHKGEKTHYIKKYALGYVAVLFIYIAIRLYHGATFMGAIFYTVSIIYLVFLFVKESYCRELLNTYLTLYSLLIGLSFISWIGVLLGISPTLGVINHYIEDWTYTVHPLCVQLWGGEGIRFCGLFDEPGVIGNTAIILLCLKGFEFKDWRMVVVLLSGLFSISLYFYIVIVVFLLINSFFIKRSFILGSFLLLIGVSFYFSTRDNPVLYETLWSRMEWDSSTNTIAGDDRMTENAEIYYQKIKGTSEYYWGVKDQQRYAEISHGGSSYKNIIATSGAVFFFIYLFWFLALAYKCQKFRFFILYAIMVISMFYQRINLYNPYWLFVLIVYAQYGALISNTRWRN